MSEQTETSGTEVVRREDRAENGGLPAPTTRFDLASVGDPTAGLQKAEELVQYMSSKCSGEEYIANIQGRDFPRCEWWTSVGAGLGLFPQEESVRRLDREGEIAYEAVVGVYDGEQRVTRGSAICSSSESTWEGRDEYAIRSMAITRATSKAYRNGLSFLAVMADLEPTPAEEMQGTQSGGEWSPTDTVGFGKHSELTWEELAEQEPGYCEWMLDKDVDRAPERAKDYLHGVLIEGAAEERNTDLPDEDTPNWKRRETAKARNQFQVELLNWTSEDRAARVFRAFAKMSEDYPSDVKEWIPADYERAIEAWSEDGKTLLVETEEWIDENREDPDA